MKKLNPLKFCIIALLLAVCSLNALAQQEPNKKFGKPTDWEWNYSKVDYEPSANAVVLYFNTYCTYDYRANGLIVLTHVKKRVKVLSDDGKDAADFQIMLRTDEVSSYDDRVTSLKVNTYNMENGKLVKSKLNKNNISEEQVTKHIKFMKVKPEQAKKGAIVEIEYEKMSQFYRYVEDWYPQDDIPTLYADYEIIIPDWFRFSPEQTGMNKVEVEKGFENITLNVNGEPLHVSCNKFKAKGLNLPSLKTDEFVWQELDFADKFTFEMNGITIPGAVYKSFSQTWDDINKTLYDDSDFGGRLKRSNPLKKEMQEAGIMNLKTPKDKIEAIMKLLQSKVKWNGHYGLWGSSASDIFKKGEGDNADINFLIINMLEGAGVKAVPIVMSTRKHGRLPLSHPSLEYLNTFIVGAYLNDTTLTYLDGSMKNGLSLPANLITDRACVIGKAPFWVQPAATEKGTEAYNIIGKLGADGKLEFQGRSEFKDCWAPVVVNTYKDAKDSTTYVNERGSKNGVNFSKYSIKYTEGLNPKCQKTFAGTKSYDTTPENIYFSPMLYAFRKDNPFKDEERKMPVEYPFIQNYIYSTTITLPEGYTVESLPKSQQVASPDKSLQFVINYQETNGRLYMRCNVKVNKQLYTAPEYPILKAFMDQVTAHNNDVVVLKKNS